MGSKKQRYASRHTAKRGTIQDWRCVRTQTGVKGSAAHAEITPQATDRYDGGVVYCRGLGSGAMDRVVLSRNLPSQVVKLGI